MQFLALLHEDVQDATGDGKRYGWMDAAAERCPQRFAKWIAGQFRAKRVLSRQVLQAKAAAVLGTPLDE